MKIFPRNLTARADHVVRGNPASSRTESGVDNCYPGLEFDQRNLDKAFFPGLTFEFHRGNGAIVVDIHAGGGPAQAGLRATDLPLFLWAVLGPMPADASRDISVSLRDLGGLEAWRHVHDLAPGRILVLVGPPRRSRRLPSARASTSSCAESGTRGAASSSATRTETWSWRCSSVSGPGTSMTTV